MITNKPRIQTDIWNHGVKRQNKVVLVVPMDHCYGCISKRADLLPEYQQDRLQALLVKLLERTGEENRFARNDEAIYPTVEVLLTEGYYFSGEGLAGNQRWRITCTSSCSIGGNADRSMGIDLQAGRRAWIKTRIGCGS